MTGAWWMAFVLIHLGIASFNYVPSKLMNDDAPFLDGTWPNLVRLLGSRSGWITAMVFLLPQVAIDTKRFHDEGSIGLVVACLPDPFPRCDRHLDLIARRRGLPVTPRRLGAIDRRLYGNVDTDHARLLAVEKGSFRLP